MYFILRSINSQKQLRLNDMRNTLMSVRVCYYYVLCSLFFHGVFLPLYTSNKKINRILIRRSAFPAKIHELFEIVRMSLFGWMDNHKTYTRLRVGGYAFVLFFILPIFCSYNYDCQYRILLSWTLKGSCSIFTECSSCVKFYTRRLKSLKKSSAFPLRR